MLHVGKQAFQASADYIHIPGMPVKKLRENGRQNTAYLTEIG